jgi:hypothetical protein
MTLSLPQPCCMAMSLPQSCCMAMSLPQPCCTTLSLPQSCCMILSLPQPPSPAHSHSHSLSRSFTQATIAQHMAPLARNVKICAAFVFDLEEGSAVSWDGTAGRLLGAACR